MNVCIFCSSTIPNEINDIFIIQLLENELILKNDKTVYEFIYQNIVGWVCSKKNTLFGILF